MIKDSPAGVTRIVLAQGHVWLRTAPARLARGLALDVAGMRTDFAAVPDDDAPTFGLPLTLRPRFDPAALGAPLPAFRPMLNALPDWRLESRDTLQLKVADPQAPASFDIAASIPLPKHGKDLQFAGLLADHRAAGRLRVTIETLRGQPVESFEFPFDDRFHGGRQSQGYGRVQRPLLPCAEKSVLRMAILFDRNLAASDEAEPCFFLADPHVARLPRHGAVPAEDLHSSPAATAPDQIWARARVPATLAPGDRLNLIAGEDSTTLATGRDAALALIEDRGHTVTLAATEAGQFDFLIDGAPAVTAFVGTQPTELPLPSRYFNGESRSFSAWDRGRTQRFLLTGLTMPRLLSPADMLRGEHRSPHPGCITVRDSYRLAGVKAQLQCGHDVQTLNQLGHALSTLEGGHDNVRLQPLTFPHVDAPDVSIVIPAHNKVQVTYLALASLLVAANRASFEVIVVDDGSTDATAHLERIVQGITVLHNAVPQRFIRACNAGAAVARGTHIVLLNNDTEVTTGWLDALIDAFQRFPRVGLAGSKLIYPDGQLQDAGGIVWGSGNPWQYGNRQNPWDPRFSYARQADYLCGAAMMTTRAIWDRVGGLSAYLEPMYFEDTDFAFKVREAGYSTWFVPASVVYHYEGITSGTGTGAGHKRFQEINRPKFKHRWSGAFQGGGPDGTAPDLEKDRGIAGRILVIGQDTPRLDRAAGQEMRLIQSMGHKVTFLPTDLSHRGSLTEDLQRNGIEVLHAPFALSVADVLDNRGAEFDAVYVQSRAAIGGAVNRNHPDAPTTLVLRSADALSALKDLRPRA